MEYEHDDADRHGPDGSEADRPEADRHGADAGVPPVDRAPALDDPLTLLTWPAFGRSPLQFDGPLGDAPDLASAFLAALDAVDDARLVTPPADDEPSFPQALLESPESPESPESSEPPAARAIEALVADSAPAAAIDVDADVDADADAGDPEVLEDLEEFVVFSLADWRCVVPIRNVLEVGRIPEAAPVPNAPVWMHGLGNLRGQVLALIDLRAFFGVGRIKPSTGRMVVLRADGDEVTAGVMVDQVHQIVALSPSRFRGAPDTLSQRTAPFVWGACDYGNFTMMGLDVDSVLGVEHASDEAR